MTGGGVGSTRSLRGIGGLFDRIADSYDSAVPFFTPFAADLAAWATPPRDGTVLDLCCGDGACLAALLPMMADGTVIGIDLSYRMLSAIGGRRPAAEKHRRMAPVLADAGELPFQDSAFDAFYCALSWHFLSSPSDALNELWRTGRPGATLAISMLGPSRHTWPFLGRVLSRYVPRLAPGPGAAQEEKPLDARMRESGWLLTGTEERSRQFEFSGATEWLAWQWSHTGRVYFEQVEDSRREALQESLLREAEQAHRRTGLRFTQHVTFIHATRIGGDVRKDGSNHVR
ncbi:class I SAM-dependent methyltransferase [Streptosporangium algeriense]|uniref:Class I SAM-dependent methyltransferase n=1 Tax=Streptosporangium algeriense TaxID=1682748 RepID=A0ABW3DHX2_9ACTN